MKEFICKKDFYIDDLKFASEGDHVVLLQDNTTVVNTNGKQRVTNMPKIVDDNEYFTPTFEIKKVEKEDNVNHPPHYTWLKDKCGIEVLDITRHMDFCLGNAVKYILRSGKKDKNKEVEDLKKAIFYINDKINQLENK